MIEDFKNIGTIYHRYAKSGNSISLTSHDTESIIDLVRPHLKKMGFDFDSSYLLKNCSFSSIINDKYPEDVLLTFNNIHTSIDIKFNYSARDLLSISVAVFGLESLSKLPDWQFKRSRLHSFVVYLNDDYQFIASCFSFFTENPLFPQFELSFDEQGTPLSITKFKSFDGQFASQTISLIDIEKNDVYNLIMLEIYSDSDIVDELFKDRFGPVQEGILFDEKITIIEAYHI